MVPFEGFSDGQGEPSSRAGVYKAQVASAALKGDRTISEVAAHYEIHVNLAAHWKKQLLEGAASVFTKDGKSAPPPDDPRADRAAPGGTRLREKTISRPHLSGSAPRSSRANRN